MTGVGQDQALALGLKPGAKDIGPTLYAMGVLGWFILITIPTGIFALMVFPIIGLLVRTAKSRNKSDA
jgi:hypothetical protein